MRYKLKILTNSKTYEYVLRDIPMYDWDSILGFDASQETLRQQLNSILILKKITSLMISSTFFDEFYDIINMHRENSFLYKYLLPTILFAVQYSLVEKVSVLKEPGLVYIESFQDDSGTFVKYLHIDDRWNYEALVS
ncbi:DUF1473 family protein [Borrelia miyamotoi]|uniref:DUF1473 family protein n=1 Tax=Borrelia miyamotoi TaxID=47466 RepID=A0AAQ2WVV4_9SPIR|nr:DUF1473 family protein [Borrelia miyamotoi]AOW96377.1 hypothetical protein AXH25_04390 [Borrelia miyamotoi]QTL84095.1 DUF1473 family protein [Borrelia miyamotoi]WAZ85742.1 DUF1473 family protein [Borrelia miyamotoi]WAZ91524.1 DUF1473 family protein [Borrelia miyamotoi]WAZ92812.1 DUF1473 family protein [Borrelia miyamotoi]